jgi:transcriptional regulator with XRE-family HTH domain
MIALIRRELTMQIENMESLLAALEAARLEKGLSERELSRRAGMKSPGAYWWWKRNIGTTLFSTALKYAEVLGLKFKLSQ